MLSIQGVTYIHPNGDRLLSGLDFAISKFDKIALVGNNGVGKSTLLKLIAGHLVPSSGSVISGFRPYLVPQVTGQFKAMTLAQALGVDEKLNALKEVLQGIVSERNLEIVGADWTLEERCAEAFDSWKLPALDLSDSINELSGGEKTKVLLAGLIIHKPDLVLLDEPSNHLDSAGRKLLYEYVTSSRQSMVIVSHDRALLNLVSATYELSNKGIKAYGGNYDFYEAQKAIEKNAMTEEIRSQEKLLRKAKELARETVERKEKLDARGHRKQEKAGIATIMMNTLRNNAEKSSARLKGVHAEKIDEISRNLKSLRSEVVESDTMKLNLDESRLHHGKILVTAKDLNVSFDRGKLWNNDVSFEIRSGERVAIAGANGSGKTTLIRLLLGISAQSHGTIQRATCRSVYIDQNYALLDNALTVFEQAQLYNSDLLPEHEMKIRLNRFLFTKADWDKSVVLLSGGEKMRLLLCLLAIGTQAPDMIVLDEPTNNLDLANLEMLTRAISQYRGTLIVVSHDERFLDEVGIGRRLELHATR
ncbi:MAG TPA: ABC-F family ATP-binding cassette domain-containing protein [Chryseosolibacter sp.]